MGVIVPTSALTRTPPPASFADVVIFIRLLLVLFLCMGCKESYRVGDYVLVDWCEGDYPAYVLAKKGRTRYRVHFDGYESRWDTYVSIEAIKGRLREPPASPPPLCDRVARALGIQQPEKGASTLYRAGARIKVTWRGSVYTATVLSVEGPDRFKIHYEGYDSAWDEVISSDRIVGALR